MRLRLRLRHRLRLSSRLADLLIGQIDDDLLFRARHRDERRLGGDILDEKVGNPARRGRTSRIRIERPPVGGAGLLEPPRAAMLAGQTQESVTNPMAVAKQAASLNERLPGLDIAGIAAEKLLEKLRTSLRGTVPDDRECVRNRDRLGR